MRTLIQPPTPIDSGRDGPDTLDAPDLDALGDCVGYRVDDPNGRVGTVAGLVAGAWTDRPDAIEVRAGLFRPAILMVPADAVACVHRARRRVILCEGVDLADASIP